MNNTIHHRWASARRLAGLATAGTLGLVGALAAVPAQAAPVSVDDASLVWAINAESGGGAYFGGCNFLSAGVAGNTGSSRVWTEADGFYSAQAGSVHIEKPTASGGWEAPTWATKCQNATGAAVTVAPTSTSGNRVRLTDGHGTVDAAAGTATIAWTGAFTVVYYGGMTYWTASDPVLTVTAGGHGTLTATGSGFATSMEDQSQWAAISPRTITLATFTGLQLDASGFTTAPDYHGVEVTPASGTQARTGDNWGAFPQDFVTFHGLTGQGAYWYSSGSTNDVKKVAASATVQWQAPPPSAGDNEISLEVTVPEQGPPTGPGEFTWTITGAGAVSLGTAQAGAQAFTATGALRQVVVTDTRDNQPAWSLAGQVSAFTDGQKSFSGSAAGWQPRVSANTVGAQAGGVVQPGQGAGLGQSATLASAAAGHPKGSASIDADLSLAIPLSTDPGDYTGLLTLTAIG